MGAIDLNGIRLRNRLLTSASLLGYGASKKRLILYGLSPIAQWVPLDRFGAVTTRTVTLQPREGHFTLREDWSLREFPEMLRLYSRALKRVDAGWLNAFGWSRERALGYMQEHTLRTETQIAPEILRYGTDMPGQALAYQVGNDKIRELRRRAEEALGERFDVRRFHDAVLDYGPMPLAVLEAHVGRFIEGEAGRAH